FRSNDCSLARAAADKRTDLHDVRERSLPWRAQYGRDSWFRRGRARVVWKGSSRADVGRGRYPGGHYSRAECLFSGYASGSCRAAAQSNSETDARVRLDYGRGLLEREGRETGNYTAYPRCYGIDLFPRFHSWRVNEELLG